MLMSTFSMCDVWDAFQNMIGNVTWDVTSLCHFFNVWFVTNLAMSLKMTLMTGKHVIFTHYWPTLMTTLHVWKLIKYSNRAWKKGSKQEVSQAKPKRRENKEFSLLTELIMRIHNILSQLTQAPSALGILLWWKFFYAPCEKPSWEN